MGEDLIERQLPAAGDLGDDLHQPVALLGCVAGAHVLAHARQGCLEAHVIDGLEQVVDGARLEGLDGVLVIGGYEHQHRQRLLRQVREHLEPGHARHLDVQEHQVGLVLLDGGHRLAAVGALRDDLEVGGPAQAQLDAAPRQHLVIDDDRADLHAAPRVMVGGNIAFTLAGSVPGSASSSGRRMSTRTPGCALLTLNRQASP